MRAPRVALAVVVCGTVLAVLAPIGRGKPAPSDRVARVAASAAPGYIYWTAPQISLSIGRASLGGTGIDSDFVSAAAPGYDPLPSAPYGVAVDGGYIYWANPTSQTIGRADLDGTDVDPTFITVAGYPSAVAVNGTHIYWTDADTADLLEQTPNSDDIGRANLDGTDVDQTFITGANNPLGIAVRGGHIYWSNATSSGGIGRANLGGTHVNQNFIKKAGYPQGIAVAGAYIYWSKPAGSVGLIRRANLHGRDVKNDFITGTDDDITGVAVKGNYIYWATSDAIGRATLNGRKVDQSFMNGVTAYGVAVEQPDRVTRPAAGAPSARVYFFPKYGYGSAPFPGVIKPDRVLVGISQPNPGFAVGLRWRGWSGPRAVGRGRLQFKGAPGSYPITIVARDRRTAIVEQCGSRHRARYYARVTARTSSATINVDIGGNFARKPGPLPCTPSMRSVDL